MKDHQGEFVVERRCEVFGVSRSAYYDRLRRKQRIPPTQIWNGRSSQNIPQVLIINRIHPGIQEFDFNQKITVQSSGKFHLPIIEILNRF